MKTACAPDGLRWVIHDGVERQVSDFAALPPGRRPLCLCPQCGEKVIPHLGSILRHHAAHEPGSTCSATAPETELHLAAKFHLAAVLRNMQRIEIEQTCSTKGCSSVSKAVWLENWDEVAVEHRVGTRRPDVTLLRGGVPVGAVEVFVSHCVDDETAQALEALSLPWIEVRADMILPLAGKPWSGGPLSVANEGPSRVPWKCAPHAADPTEEHDAHHDGYDRDALIKVCDYYCRHGETFRCVYFLVESGLAGSVGRLELNVFNGLEDNPLERNCYSLVNAVEYPECLRSARSYLTSAFKRNHARHAAQADLTDSPMKWSETADLPHCGNSRGCFGWPNGGSCEKYAVNQPWINFFSDAYFPRRFCWDKRTSAWRIREGCESLRWEAPFRKWSNKIQHGSEVHHAHLGRGTVLSVGWNGPSNTADVMFRPRPRGGMRWVRDEMRRWTRVPDIRERTRRVTAMPLKDLVPLLTIDEPLPGEGPEGATE